MSESDKDVSALINATLPELVPIAAAMGIEFTAARAGYVEARVPTEGNTNHVGTIYAGVLFSLAEILGGGITSSSFALGRFVPIVKDLQIRYRAPATTTIRAHAALPADLIAELDATASSVGKADFALDAELVDEAGVIVATTTGTYQIRPL